MQIGLISDTHVPEAVPFLPIQVYEAFVGVDLVLHAGDLHVVQVLDWLEELAPVYAARGNGDDGGSLRTPVPDDTRLRPAHVLKLDGWRIGLTHGFPLPQDVPWLDLPTLIGRIFGESVDIVICGDTHVTHVQETQGLVIVNPGSPTLPHNLDPQLGHVGILQLDSEGLQVKIIDLSIMEEVTPGLPPRGKNLLRRSLNGQE